jgi:dihydropteroate synthase
MIYKPLGTTPDHALIGTSALHFEALKQGAKILRVHDVLEAKQVIDLYQIYKNVE